MNNQQEISLATIDALKQICAPSIFDKGHSIYEKGAFTPVMYLVLSGEVEIEFSPESTIRIGSMAPLGEIGFFNGSSATANATAITMVSALQIDTNSLLELENNFPTEAVEFSRYLAATVDARLLQNEQLLIDGPGDKGDDIEIIRCVNEDQLQQAQRVRYDVYCTELGRTSKYADDQTKLIADYLDINGISFVATKNSVPVGTARVNLAKDGELGILENLYGMNASQYHPSATGIVTKFAIAQEFRTGSAYANLLGAVSTYLINSGIKETYIDGLPKIASFYKLLGFKKCAENFMHYENGLSVPMKLFTEDFYSERSIRTRNRIISRM